MENLSKFIEKIIECTNNNLINWEQKTDNYDCRVNDVCEFNYVYTCNYYDICIELIKQSVLSQCKFINIYKLIMNDIVIIYNNENVEFFYNQIDSYLKNYHNNKQENIRINLQKKINEFLSNFS